MARGSKIFDDPAEDRIQNGARVHDVQVERHELAAEVQLGSVIQRVAVIIFQTLLQRPRNDVAQRVEIKVQIERYAVIEPDAFIINLFTADQTKAKRDNPAALPPDEEARPFRHPSRGRKKKILGQCLKFKKRTLVNLKIERIDFIDVRSDVADDFHVDLRRAFCFTEFPAEIFPGRLA